MSDYAYPHASLVLALLDLFDLDETSPMYERLERAIDQHHRTLLGDLKGNFDTLDEALGDVLPELEEMACLDSAAPSPEHDETYIEQHTNITVLEVETLRKAFTALDTYVRSLLED